MGLLEHFFAILASSGCLACGQAGSLLYSWYRDDVLPEVVEAAARVLYRAGAKKIDAPVFA